LMPPVVPSSEEGQKTYAAQRVIRQAETGRSIVTPHPRELESHQKYRRNDLSNMALRIRGDFPTSFGKSSFWRLIGIGHAGSVPYVPYNAGIALVPLIGQEETRN